MNISDEELVAEYERRIADGTDLDGLVSVRSAPPPANTRRSVFSVRLGSDELASIAGAASKRVYVTDELRFLADANPS